MAQDLEGQDLGHPVSAAADWLLRLRDMPDDDQAHSDFADWLSADPSHAEAWRKVSRTWRNIGQVPAEQWQPAPAKIVAFPAIRSRRLRLGFASLAGLAAAACLAFVLLPSARLVIQADYQTQTAENRRITLEDGSVVHLGARSALQVSFTPERRSVALLAGEAFFEVTPNSARPFIVDVEGTQVEVVGTAFDVRLAKDAVTVAVSEGIVKVGRHHQQLARLTKGQMLKVDQTDGSATPGAVASDDVAGWRDGYLFVDGATVAEVAAEIERYQPGWIFVADDDLAGRRVTGVYDLRQPEAALRALAQAHGGGITRISGRLHILTKP